MVCKKNHLSNYVNGMQDPRSFMANAILNLHFLEPFPWTNAVSMRQADISQVSTRGRSD